MENCPADIREWMLSDTLKLNDDKTEFVIIGTRQQLAKVNIDSLTVGDYTIAPRSEVKNLGCWLDNQLKMDKHINKICQTAFYRLYYIRTQSLVWTTRIPTTETSARAECCRKDHLQCQTLCSYYSLIIQPILVTY